MAHLTRQLITDRLTLRPFKLPDAEHIYRLNTDPEVMRYLPKDEVYASPDQARDFLRTYIEQAKTWPFARWAVIRKSDEAWLGWCGLREVAEGEVDLGYRLLKEYWGRGYATESGRRWLAYGFSSAGLPKIVARAADENVGSQRVLLKLGFERRPEKDTTGDGFLWRSFVLRRP